MKLCAKSIVSGLAKSDLITGITPPKALGRLSLNAYVSAANTLTLHFCNPTTSVGIPARVYSFLSVHWIRSCDGKAEGIKLWPRLVVLLAKDPGPDAQVNFI